jgi:hypothetical protein
MDLANQAGAFGFLRGQSVDQISKQRTCTIPHHHKILESVIVSQATTQYHFIKEQERQFLLRGHQQSRFPAVSFYQDECLTSATSFCIQGADFCTQGQGYHNSQQSVSHQKSNHQQSDYSQQAVHKQQSVHQQQSDQSEDNREPSHLAAGCDGDCKDIILNNIGVK